MDLEEQQSLVPKLKPVSPIKKVRKVNYQKQSWLNYVVAILALVILGLMLAIVIDITGYKGFHLKNQHTIPVQQNQQVENYTSIAGKDQSAKLDGLIWDDNIQNTNQESSIDQEQEQQLDDNEPVEEDLSFMFEENAENEQELENTENVEQQDTQNALEVKSQSTAPENFQSATLSIGEEETNLQQIDQEVEIFDADKQLESYSLLQSGSNIILPKITDEEFNFVQLPNKMKVLLIQNENEDADAEIALNVFQGFWDTKYYLKCDKCQITVKEQQTQYVVKCKSDEIIDSLNTLSNLFLAETPKLKQILLPTTNWGQLFSQIANEEHPQSHKYHHDSTFQQSPNEMVLIIKGQFKSGELMDKIIESDIVLLRDHDIKEKNKNKILTNLGGIIKWNNQEDLNSIRLIYQLEDAKDINFFDYFVQTSFKKYIINNQFGLDVKSTTLLDENNLVLYQIQVALPFQDQMDYDQRELAYRLAKIVTIFANQVQEKLLDEQQLTEYCKQMIDQLQKINNLQFDYTNQELNYIEIAKNLKNGEVEEALHYKYLVQVLPEKFQQTLTNIQQTSNLLIIVSDSQYKPEYSFLQIRKGSASSDLQFLTQNGLTEDKDGIQYSVKEIAEQTKQFIETIDEEIQFDFPEVNKYIPQQFELVETQTSLDINDQVHLDIDVSNKLPIIDAEITIHTYGQHIYAEYIYERVLMEFQDAINVGYKFDIGQQQYLQMQIQGWSDQYPQIFKGVMNILREKPNPELKAQLQNKFDMLPDHIKLVKFKIDSIMIVKYQKPTFGVIGQNYQMKLKGNLLEDEAKELDQLLNKALHMKMKSKHQSIKIYDLTQQEIVYQMKAKEKWHLLINYYQFVNLNEIENELLNNIQDYFQERAHEEHIIFEKKIIACARGFFLIKQSSSDLNDQKVKLDNYVDKVLNDFNDKQKKLNLKEFWSQKSGKITFFIDENKRETTMNNLKELECE